VAPHVVDADPKSDPVISIIVPLHRWTDRSKRSVAGCLEQAQSASAEVIVVCDQPISDLPFGAQLIVTGSPIDTSPAYKRDLAGKQARGALLAFIDDDAVPDKRWLQSALSAFEDLNVDAVGGPGLTPVDSTHAERLSGAIYGSVLGSGPLRYRFKAHGEARLVSELPAFNFIVKRECMDAIGGWNSDFYGGEDTSICTRLRAKGYRLAYLPDTLVFHYRRRILRAHLRQVGNVGRHRGYFVRRHDESSLRWIYFVPAFLVLISPAIVGGLAMAAYIAPLTTLSVVVASWLLIALIAFRRVGWRTIFFPGALAVHHFWYGFNFLLGLLSKRVHRQLSLEASP